MKFRKCLPCSMILLSLAACGQGANHNDVNNRQGPAVTPASAPTPSEQLLAAAEPFEKLTEIAFTAPLPEIDSTIVEARRAVDSVRTLLPAGSNTDTMFAAIDQARKSENRADLALASIEIYRTLVSAVPAGTKVPAAVSLLDYAGFRYQADLKAVPVRWADMGSAMLFARGQWSDVAPRITDAALKASFEKSLANMEKAVAKRDLASAQASATEELNLVDKLEAHFGG